MSRILDLQQKLQDTSAAIAEFEKAVGEHPDSPALSAMLRSFTNRQAQLEGEFATTTKETGTGVCRYRFFSDMANLTVKPLCSALSAFQDLYSVAYDAIHTGPRKKSRKPPPDIAQASSFGFGYTFSGSVGVVLTLQDDARALFGKHLDETMDEVASLALAQTSEELVDRGRLLGVPVVRALYKWAKSHADSGMGADIEWRKGQETLTRLMLHRSEIEQLASVIASTTQIVTEEEEVEGILETASTKRRTFEFTTVNGSYIKGTFGDEIPTDRTFEVGARFKLMLRKQVKVFYSTEEEQDAKYELVLASRVPFGVDITRFAAHESAPSGRETETTENKEE